jgi:hypothetical protein
MSLMQLVPLDGSLSDWMFGPLPDCEPFTACRCFTHTVLQLEADRILIFALTPDSDWVFSHSDSVHYSDSEHVVIEAAPVSTRFQTAGAEFYRRISIRRASPTDDVPGYESSEYWDNHRFGGHSFHLQGHPSPSLVFVAQIAFPASDDTADLNLNWPTGEMTVELFFDSEACRYCALWRMHA